MRLDGTPMSVARQPSPVRSSQSGLSLAKDFSAERLWRAVCAAARQAVSQSGVALEDIAAIGVTSQRQGLCFLDGAGKELYLAPNTDLRAVMEGAAQDEAHRERIYQTTGHLPSFLLASGKLQWFKSQKPKVYQRIRTVMTLGDWLTFRLTGERTGERTLACEAGLLDVTSGTWAAELLKELGLQTDWFPRLVPSGAVVGKLTASAAGDLGLAGGVTVVTAGADTQCGLLGMGVVGAGQVGVLAGWSMTAQQVTSQPVLDGSYRTLAGLHGLPDTWVSEVNLGDTGNALTWSVRTLYGGESQSAFTKAGAEAADSDAGGVVAILGTAPVDFTRLGMRTGGLLFPVPMAYSGVGRAALVRAHLESMTFAVREALERLQEVTGTAPTRVAVGGGMTRVPLFTQLVADACGREVALCGTPDASAYGAALLAAVAAGGFKDAQEAARLGAANATAITPDAERALQYNDHYARWRHVRTELERISLG